MFIHEAINATTVRQPCIARRAWNRFSKTPGSGVKIQPTNSPDGCIIESDVDRKTRRSWQPTAGDLVAEDWEPVGL